jgi:cardiolipin synthase (CMP-forming)
MWNISNLLSLLRLILAVPISVALILNKPYLAFGMGMIAFISDFLDGYFARKLNQVTELGKIIDPLADKVVVISVVLVLFFQGKFPLWLGASIISRDILILIGGLLIKRKLGYALPSNFAGKLTVTVIAIYIFGVILNTNWIIVIGPFCVIVMLIFSFILYVIKGRKALIA